MVEFEQVGKILRVTEKFKNGNIRAIVENVCPRCNGRGILPQVKHVDGGRCYQCEGTGVQETSRVVMTLENRKKAELVKARQNQSKQEAYAERQAQFKLEHEARERIKEKQLAKNKAFTIAHSDLIRSLDMTNGYDRDFGRNLREVMSMKPLNALPLREKEYICDYLARKKHRRYSKPYNVLYERLINDLNKDYSIE